MNIVRELRSCIKEIGDTLYSNASYPERKAIFRFMFPNCPANAQQNIIDDFDRDFNAFFPGSVVEDVTLSIAGNKPNHSDPNKPRIVFVHPHGVTPFCSYLMLRDRMCRGEPKRKTVMLVAAYNNIFLNCRGLPMHETAIARCVERQYGLSFLPFTHESMNLIFKARWNVIVCPDGYSSMVTNTRSITRVFTQKYRCWLDRAIRHGYDLDIAISPNLNQMIADSCANETMVVFRYILSFWFPLMAMHRLRSMTEETEYHYFKLSLPHDQHMTRKEVRRYTRDLIDKLRRYCHDNMSETVVI